MPSLTRIRDRIVSKLNATLFEFTVQELEFMMNDEYLQSTQILEYMELTLYAHTRAFRQRCQLWHHKLNLQETRYPTLLKLIHYRHIYENWDGEEPYPGREVKQLYYYID